MMIVDECHHVTALQFEKVVAQFASQYLYGLTATPECKMDINRLSFSVLVQFYILLNQVNTILKRGYYSI